MKESPSINVRGLRMPHQPERSEAPFDPMRDIKPHEWKRMIDFTNSLRGNGDFLTSDGRGSWMVSVADFRKCAGMLKTMNPTIAFEFSEKEKERLYTKTAWDHRQSEYLWGTRLLVPETFAPDDQSKEHLWNDLLIEISGAEKRNGWTEYLRDAAKAKVAFPEREIDISETNWKSIYEHIYMHRRMAPATFAEDAAFVRILDPARSVNLGSSDWEAMRLEYHEEIDHEDKGFEIVAMETAFSMAVLSAERIEIDENGLHLIMPSAHSEPEVPPVPMAAQLPKFG